MQAEEVGEDRSGELRGEIEQRGTAPCLGVDADGPQAFAERGGGDRAAGQVPGEQPGGSGRGLFDGAQDSYGGVGLAAPGMPMRV